MPIDLIEQAQQQGRIKKIGLNELPVELQPKFAETEKTGERLNIKQEGPVTGEPQPIDLLKSKGLNISSDSVTLPAEFGGKTITKEQYKQFIESRKKQSFLEFVNELPEYAGGAVGGIIGAPSGPAGAIGGAALGGAGVAAYRQLIDRAFGLESPKTGEEAAKKIALVGGEQALYEAGGQVIGGLVGKVLAPFSKSVTPEAKIAMKTLETYMPLDKTSKLRVFSRLTKEKVPTLLPSEATENRVLDYMTNIAEGSFIGGKRIGDFKDIIRKQAVEDMTDDFVRQFGQNVEPDLLGDAFVMAVEGRLDASRLVSKSLYTTVEEMVKPLSKQVPITRQVPTGILSANGQPLMKEVTGTVTQEIFPTKALKDFARPLHKRAVELGGIEAKNAGDDLITAVMELPEYVSYKTAQELRSRLISRADEFSVINKKAPAIGKARKLASLTDESIGRTLSEQNPEALRIWRNANKLYKHGNEQFNNEFIRRLVKEAEDKGNPEVIVQRIFKPNAISNIRKVKTAVDEQTWNSLKTNYVNALVNKSLKDGNLSGNLLQNNLFGRAGMGEQTLKEIFSPAEYMSLKNLKTTLQVVQKGETTGTGKMWIQLTQAGALVGMLSGTARPISTVILGGPLVLSRILTNPKFNRLLTEGYKLPAGSPQAVALMGRITALAYQTEQEMKQRGEIPYSQDELQKLPGTSTIR